MDSNHSGLMRSNQVSVVPLANDQPSFVGHFKIMRVDHWFKNVFVIPGIITAIGVEPTRSTEGLWARIIVGMISICLIASSNYVINEVLDAPSDRWHRVKRTRPVPSGQVNVPLAYVQWVALMVIGVWMGLLVSTAFAITVSILWVMGCIYNIPPIRSKDLPYVDVLSEAVNNPLRMVAGWFIGSMTSFAPASLLLSYWMVGCYFMAIKRYAEYREIGDRTAAAAYRKSFAFYTSERLIVSVMFYGSAAMLFLGASVMRYRLELILAFPLVALVMAIYLNLSFKKNSAVQNPEGLYKEPTLMAALILCSVVMATLMLVDIPVMQVIFSPTAPTILDRKQ